MRVKTGFTRHRRHKKVLETNKGYRMSRHRLFKVAQESAMHAGQYAYAGRKNKKRDFRKLWIIRLNAAAGELGMSYSRMIAALRKAKVELNRKILADVALNDPVTFKIIINKIKAQANA